MSPWTKFATSFYRQQKKKNENYKFSQALIDAAEVYNGGDEENKKPEDVSEGTQTKPDVLEGANPDVSEGGPETGGKKSKKSAKKGKKSAKKGKKSAKKGGKKARKSAKKRKC